MKQLGRCPRCVALQVEAGEVDEALERLRPLGPDLIALQVEAGEVDEALERLRPLGPDAVAGQVEAGEVDEALERLRPLGPDAVGRSRLVRLTRPLSACAPSSPMRSGGIRSSVVRLTRPLSACAPRRCGQVAADRGGEVLCQARALAPPWLRLLCRSNWRGR